MITEFKDYRDLPFSKEVQDELFNRHAHVDDHLGEGEQIMYKEKDVLELLQMMKGKGYTPEEQKISDAITAAHLLYCDLPETHPADIDEWVRAIHQLQHVLSIRILRRDYPDKFKTITK